MPLHPLAGKPAPREILVNIPRLITAYFIQKPDATQPDQQVRFGTSGHRGSSFKTGYNEDHILAVVQAVCDYRRAQQIDGPLFLGQDTHALSEPSQETALEVLGANAVSVRIARDQGYTPTPVISQAILDHNRGRKKGLADGLVITPSHNPPEDGGIKYNPPHGGPAETAVTRWIEDRANELLVQGRHAIRRIPRTLAVQEGRIEEYDFITPYVEALEQIIDLEAIRRAGLRLGVDPLGGASVAYWEPIARRYDLNIELVNPVVDPTFSFMSVDKDGKIRMDCSSPYAMAGLIELKDRYDIAFGNDADCDRHGIVCPSEGLLNPNHYLSVAVWYLFRNRPEWPARAAIGKTLVSSSLIDRIAAHLNRPLAEVPVGFKWFVEGLQNGDYGIGLEESAGASFLRRDGTVWSTDKDGIILDLLAAEITAREGKDPGILYRELTGQFGAPLYERMDAPASPAQKEILSRLSPEQIQADTLAGEPIRAKLTRAPANQAPIGGLKVVAENGWFAARPSGTEDIYKIYTESFKGPEHLAQIQAEAQEIVRQAFQGAGE
ncbi:MAG: alpha-D-glucose phosphate-specific phosphoglucomutase [Deltaproteobacteria bacterium]|nr:alpha-D-glucose phosphate-specific phosphoglucomutase [Deltaproteobacteria bacterium]